MEKLSGINVKDFEDFVQTWKGAPETPGHRE